MSSFGTSGSKRNSLGGSHHQRKISNKIFNTCSRLINLIWKQDSYWWNFCKKVFLEGWANAFAASLWLKLRKTICGFCRLIIQVCYKRLLARIICSFQVKLTASIKVNQRCTHRLFVYSAFLIVWHVLRDHDSSEWKKLFSNRSGWKKEGK